MGVQTSREFGVMVVGDEILTGKRQDRHLPHVIDMLRYRGMTVAWSLVVGDARHRLAETFRLTQQDEIPVFCFGGIGATPDDVTRQAAADAFGSRLVRHPEAVQMIEGQFGDSAYPNRILMADLPEDCLLIPNGYNDIPGFTLYDHHFFPGFPMMAWPMLEWVLDRYYPLHGAPVGERSIRVTGVRESDLLPLMEWLSERHPDARFFSLPHIGETSSIEMGFRGEPVVLEAAFAELITEIQTRGLPFEHVHGADTQSAA